jgi:hypothetical protein
MSETELEILVVESRMRAPTFTSPVEMTIHLNESYNDFSTPVATVSAV